MTIVERRLPGDAMNPVAIRKAIAATDAQFGRIDILVNNFWVVCAPVLMQSERSWRRYIGFHLTSMLATTG
jgi:NAD(P)-dependent dehydrogenase (short-subunit alcohol dehydrogenase family)